MTLFCSTDQVRVASKFSTVPARENSKESLTKEKARAKEVESEGDRITSAFKSSPHHLWKATSLSSLSRFDYWLQHLSPERTEAVSAKLVDQAVDRAVRACLRGTDAAEDELIKKRLALPIRMGGGGLRSREQLRYAAYAGSLITSATVKKIDCPVRRPVIFLDHDKPEYEVADLDAPEPRVRL